MAQDTEIQNKFSGVLKSLPEFEITAEDSAFVIIDIILIIKNDVW